MLDCQYRKPGPRQRQKQLPQWWHDREKHIQNLSKYAIKSYREQDFLNKFEKESNIQSGRFYYFEDMHAHYHHLLYAYPKLKKRLDEVKRLVDQSIFRGLTCSIITVVNKSATVGFVCLQDKPRIHNRMRAYSQALQLLLEECESVSVDLQLA